DSLGIDHCAAGVMISSAWKLDSSINDVIANHHKANEYSGKNSGIVCTVAAANYLSNVYEVGFAGDKYPVKLDRKVWNTIGFNEDVFVDIMEKLYSEIERAKLFLHIS
ncbi:MAG: HDOD domain-containing protein, partial [Treponema sp.]|nr:HDOD domain-containing protein [Treponema sp.]